MVNSLFDADAGTNSATLNSPQSSIITSENSIIATNISVKYSVPQHLSWKFFERNNSHLSQENRADENKENHYAFLDNPDDNDRTGLLGNNSNLEPSETQLNSYPLTSSITTTATASLLTASASSLPSSSSFPSESSSPSPSLPPLPPVLLTVMNSSTLGSSVTDASTNHKQQNHYHKVTTNNHTGKNFTSNTSNSNKNNNCTSSIIARNNNIIGNSRDDTMIGPEAGSDESRIRHHQRMSHTEPTTVPTAGIATATSISTSTGNIVTSSSVPTVAITSTGTNKIGNRQQHHQHQQQQAQQDCYGRNGDIDGCVGIPDNVGFNLGLFGWRKKCLYILILGLMILIIVNLALTLWILKVMEFSSEGMGQLKIVAGGIQLSGQALIMDLLRASAIRSRHGQPISIESSRNFTVKTRDSTGILENHLFLGHDRLECLATRFRINDTSGRSLFSVNEKEVTIGAHSLRIDGEGGAIFRESVQTLHVRADAGRELRLESPTRQLEMSAAKDIILQSRAGSLEMTALNDIKLNALDGSLRLESSKVFLPNLKTASPPVSGATQNHEHTHRVYQLCACSNGKLFLATPHGICAGDDNSVCR